MGRAQLVADDDTLYTQSIIHDHESQSSQMWRNAIDIQLHFGKTLQNHHKWDRLRRNHINRQQIFSVANVYILPIEIQLKGRKKGGRGKEDREGGEYFLLKRSRFVRSDFSHECSGFDLLAIYRVVGVKLNRPTGWGKTGFSRGFLLFHNTVSVRLDFYVSAFNTLLKSNYIPRSLGLRE